MPRTWRLHLRSVRALTIPFLAFASVPLIRLVDGCTDTPLDPRCSVFLLFTFGRVSCSRRRAHCVLPHCESYISLFPPLFLADSAAYLIHELNVTPSFPEKCLSLTLLTAPCDPDE